MCIEKNSDDENLKLENPIKYYLNIFHDKKIMNTLKWEDPYLYSIIERLHYINQLKNKDNTHICPECKGNITSDEDGEEFCTSCGLVTRTFYPYVAGQKITLPYGLK